MLAKKTNPNNEAVTYAYDARNRVTSETYAADAAVTPSETYVYDPNGRKSSVTSSQFGAEQYVYDDDGRLIRVNEPSAGGVTSPAQISYAYYRNGQRSAVSVASAGLNQTNALSYAYRADGLLKIQAFSAFANGAWYRNYTDAGRLSTVSGADTQTHTYDGSGQLASYVVTAGTATYTHDPEGSVLTETFSNVVWPGSAASPETLTNTVNVRGELIDRGSSLTTGAGHTRTRTNSGCLITTTIPYDLSTYDPTMDAGSCDRVNGVPLSPGSGGSSTVYNGQSYPQGTRNVVTFDATGRETTTVHTENRFFQGEPGQTGGQHTPPSSATTMQTTTIRGYDVEHHLRSLQYLSTVTHTNADTGQVTTTTSGPATPMPIAWGPNGHPIRIPQYVPSAGISGFLTLHWDGDVILFVTDDTGSVVDFRIELDGDVTPHDQNFTGLTVYDRDAAGVIVQTSNATGSTGFNPLDPSTSSGPGVVGSAGFKAPNVSAQYVRSDGFAIAKDLQINGVRTFDSNLGAWTTPDAFEGDIHDPASQQKYMWNRGNAVDYRDPSGYSVCDGAMAAPCIMGGRVLTGLLTAGGAVLVGIGLLLSMPGDTPQRSDFRGAPMPETGPPGGAIRRGDSVQYYDKDGFRTKRVDLSGAAHDGVSTPHVQDFEKPNTLPDRSKRAGQQKKGARKPSSSEEKDARNRPQGQSQ